MEEVVINMERWQGTFTFGKREQSSKSMELESDTNESSSSRYFDAELYCGIDFDENQLDSVEIRTSELFHRGNLQGLAVSPCTFDESEEIIFYEGSDSSPSTSDESQINGHGIREAQDNNKLVWNNDTDYNSTHTLIDDRSSFSTIHTEAETQRPADCTEKYGVKVIELDKETQSYKNVPEADCTGFERISNDVKALSTPNVITTDDDDEYKSGHHHELEGQQGLDDSITHSCSLESDVGVVESNFLSLIDSFESDNDEVFHTTELGMQKGESSTNDRRSGLVVANEVSPRGAEDDGSGVELEFQQYAINDDDFEAMEDDNSCTTFETTLQMEESSERSYDYLGELQGSKDEPHKTFPKEQTISSSLNNILALMASGNKDDEGSESIECDSPTFATPPSHQTENNLLMIVLANGESTRTVPGECTICLESYKPGDVVVWASSQASDCTHVFHRKCITTYFVRVDGTLCPCCRQKFI